MSSQDNNVFKLVICFFKNDNHILYVILICSFILSAICIHKGHNWGGDFSQYIAQAISINNNSIKELYEQNKFSMDHSDILLGPYMYPVGFPLILSVVYFFFGMNFIVMKWVSTLFFIASLPLIYLISKKLLCNEKYALLLIACVALNKFFLVFTDNVLSDFPYLFFSLLAIYLMEKSNTAMKQLLLGVIIFYAYIVRDIGIILLPTLLIFQLQKIIIEKQYQKKQFWLYSLPYFVFAVLFALNLLILPFGNAKHYEMFLNIKFTASYFNYYTNLFSDYFFNQTISVYLWIPLFLLILTGMLYKIKNRFHILFYVLGIYFVCIMWPSEQGMRLLFPIIPFVLFYMIQGFLLLSKTIKFKYLNVTLFVFAFFIVLQGQRDSVRLSRINTDDVKTKEMENMYAFIKQNTNKDAIIEFDNPRMLRLFTERNSFCSSYSDTVKTYADYVLCGKNEKNDSLILKEIYSNNRYVFYKIIK
ncbi:MAG TPA: phospholipid carrier-dependent glycosyltransferase [Bacteroidales bacterium]|nr:phospholipid carrier-dependent glycosyltransferase [Bacteroidales bacterium]HPS17522.1 phospholipid carrier-dependent glycosyltransferase [Bacteroidales bacterium]